jgi:hypothetical protein
MWMIGIKSFSRKYKFNTQTQIDEFDVHVAVHRDKFLIIERTGCTNFSKLFILQ